MRDLAISKCGKRISYILVEVYSGESLAKLFSMSSETVIPNIILHSQRTKKLLFV